MEPRAIAVLRANALGDLVFALPALAALRRHFPRARVTLLGRAWHAEFLAGRGIVDEVVVVPDVPGLTVAEDAPASPQLDGWLRRQRERRYDVAVQLHGGGRASNPFVSALGADLTVGLQAPDAPALDRVVPYVYYQHEMVRLLEVVGLLGAEGSPYATMEVLPSDRAAAAAEAWQLAARPYLVLHPGATDPRRRWAPQRFGAVAAHAAGHGLLPVVTGTPAERDVTAAVVAAARAGGAEALDLTGLVSLAGLMGVLAQAEAVVSNDTGPLHVADALGRSTVGIFWCGNLVNGGPLRRTRHRPMVSWTVHCPDCGADCTRDLYPARTGGEGCRHPVSFVDDVPVVEVLAALDALLSSAPARA